MWEQSGYPTTEPLVTGQSDIDIRTSFVKEFQEDGEIIIKFVKSDDNEADIFTKNMFKCYFPSPPEEYSLG